jgi:hypothetical protein
LIKAAAKHKAKTYFFIEDGPYDSYDNARAALHYFQNKKQNLMFGVVFGWPLSQFALTGKPGGFGHAMWCGGWYKDGLQAVNSAGEEAGEGGKHKVTRETFNHYAARFGMMMIVDLERGEAEHFIANQIKLSDNWLVQIIKALLRFVGL